MPYIKKGTDVYKKTSSGMKMVGHSSKGRINAYMRALHMAEHGIPMKNKKK